MTDNDLRDLLAAKNETARLDYKESVNWTDLSKAKKGEIVKDILSLANLSGGGRIVFGVRDTDFEPVGMTQSDFESFDTTRLNSFLRQYTDPEHCCVVSKNEIDGKLHVTIEVPEFVSEPIICKKDLQTNDGHTILQRGAIYMRKESAESTIINSSTQMRELLTRALKHRSDDLLKSINILLSGQNPGRSSVSVFDESIAYAKGEIETKIGDSLAESGAGTMTVVLTPSLDLTSEIENINNLRERLMRSQVSYRGWSFPHLQTNTENGGSYNIANGFTSYTTWERHVESFCLFLNGLLYWKTAFWEDSGFYELRGQNGLEFVGLIYHTLEFVLFCNSFYDFRKLEPDVNISISLDKCSGRKIIATDPMITLFETYECGIDRIDGVNVDFNIVQSIADPKSISRQLAKSIFHYFNFDIEDNVLDSWQGKFLARRFFGT